MSGHALLNPLNDLRKRDKLQGLLSGLSLLHNKLNKFNNTRAFMLDSIYHSHKNYFTKHIFLGKTYHKYMTLL